MTSMRAPISIRIHDSHFGIWQDNPNDPSFNSDIFQQILKSFSKGGWKVTADPRVLKHHRCISKYHRLAAKGDLRANVEISGRCIKVAYWSEAAVSGGNSNGKEYDFNKMKRMPYLDLQRVRLEFRRLEAWLTEIAPVEVSHTDLSRLSPMERIERDYAESWHTVKELGRPNWSGDSNRRSADGTLLEHGQKVWFRNDCGRFFKGTAYYNINNMWWVIAGSVLKNKSSRELHSAQPEDLRSKINKRDRRECLERLLRKAIKDRDYRRAETLDKILFADQPVYVIWSRKNNAYYRTNYSGYANNQHDAGRYTRDEADAEVRRVPHNLEAHGPDGERIRHGEAA